MDAAARTRIELERTSPNRLVPGALSPAGQVGVEQGP